MNEFVIIYEKVFVWDDDDVLKLKYSFKLNHEKISNTNISFTCMYIVEYVNVYLNLDKLYLILKWILNIICDSGWTR